MNDMSSMLEAVRSHGLMTSTRDHTEQDRGQAGTRDYAIVLATAVLCYAALGTVLGILPGLRPLARRRRGAGRPVGRRAGADRRGRAAAGRTAGRSARAGADRDRRRAGHVGRDDPAFVDSLGCCSLSRLLVGAGEAAMMAATVLWLLRLAGPERRGRAMGHVGLANYAGLTVGPLLAQALSGQEHTPAACGSRRRSCRWWRPRSAALLGRSPDRGVAPEPREHRRRSPTRGESTARCAPRSVPALV